MAVANAGYIGAPAQLGYAGYAAAPAVAYAQPIGKAVVAKTIDADFDPHPQYSYAYDVQDSITGDFKNQHETRDGDLVRGSYSLLEADGSTRTVDYTADSQNGFNAIVRKDLPKVAAPVIAAAPAKIAYAQPIAAAPAKLAYAQPIAAAPAKIAYAQPQFSYAPAAQYSYAQPAQYSYAQPAQYSYAQPAQYSYAQPAQYNYAQPIAAAPALSPAHGQITYAQPIAKYAPALSYGAPVAKIGTAGPLSYIAHVAYSTPYFSYSH